MIEITGKLNSRRRRCRPAERLVLPFESRRKRLLRATLASGEEVSFCQPRGRIVRGGDLLLAADGRIIEVVAAPERLLHVQCARPAEMLRAAYHLGNRHVPVEIGAGYLRLPYDPVLAEMLRALGAELARVEAPFEPETGAYGPHHAANGGAAIHEYGDAERD
jgi:urease accessory protein